MMATWKTHYSTKYNPTASHKIINDRKSKKGKKKSIISGHDTTNHGHEPWAATRLWLNNRIDQAINGTGRKGAKKKHT